MFAAAWKVTHRRIHEMYPRCLIFYCCAIRLTGLVETVFMPNYEYIKDFGWLRLHTVPTTWANARLRCNLEGGKLASPTTANISKLMMTTMTAHGLSKSRVFVDIHASKPKGNFISVDGTPVSNISLEWAAGEPNNLGNSENCVAMTGSGKLADVNCAIEHPYICINNDFKIIQKRCDTTSKAYKYESRTGSCYKFYRDPIPWRLADLICFSEHAHLAVINSDKEAKILKDLFAKNPTKLIKGATYGTFCHMGFYITKGETNTVLGIGQTLEQAGYMKWEGGRPDPSPSKQCGTMSRDGLLSNTKCTKVLLPFICETKYK